jgi:hypothetical protein
VEVGYAFHPLFGRPAIVVADQLHNGNRHLTPRSGDGPSFLVPAWMVDPAAASFKIVDVPRLSVARLLDLRAFLDSGVASGLDCRLPQPTGWLRDHRAHEHVGEFLARLCSASGRFPYHHCAGDPARSAQGLDGSKGIGVKPFRLSLFLEAGAEG